MHGSATSLSASLSSWLLVLLCAVSGAYCLRRVRGAGGGAAAGEAVMAFGMALMAVPLALGGGWRAPLLGGVFCAAALHALWMLRHGLHHAHHLVGSLTMAHLALAPAAAGQGAAHAAHAAAGPAAASGPPLLTGALLLYYAGYVVLGGTRLIAAGSPAGAAGGEVGGEASRARAGGEEPAEFVRACRLTMGMGMLAMLLTM
ncbi:DUF5134 domain-containing protein [Streptomyces sp. NPDC089922]|uniref:DUF5134 domain-containing protein n=1 Tax=Streptomyces sp. NPDC089922 TaxID=3155189 RepID=UPI0034348832